MAPFRSQHPKVFSSLHPFSLTLTFLLLSYKQLSDYLRITRIIQDSMNLNILNLITFTKFLLTSQLTQSLFLELGHEHHWVSLFSLP